MNTTKAGPSRVLDLVLVGTGEDIAALTAIARRAGALVAGLITVPAADERADEG